MAASARGSARRWIKLADRCIRLEFACAALEHPVLQALAHLEVAEQPAALVVCLWESAGSGTAAPAFPWQASGPQSAGFCEGEYKMWTYGDERFRMVLQPSVEQDHVSLSVLDSEQQRAFFWVPSSESIPYYDVGSPLRAILHWWLADQQIQMVHAAAVGTADAGVLICGRSHSGKSTTALACLESGLSYLSDDYCAFSRHPVPVAHSLYCAAKLNSDNIARFPRLESLVTNKSKLSSEKALLFLHPDHASLLVRSFPIKAIIAPKVTPGVHSSLAPMSKAASLRALAPSTMFQLQGATHSAFDAMSELIRAVPTYTLHAGSDLVGVAAAVRGLLC